MATAARTRTTPAKTRAARAPKVITPDGDAVEDPAELVDEEDQGQDEEDDLEEAAIPAELRFVSDAEAREDREADPGTVFEFDGRRYRAFKPKDAVMVTLIAANSDRASDTDRVNAVIRWLDHCLEDSAKHELSSRIYDREDKLEWEDLAAIMTSLLQYWGKGKNRAERRAIEQNRPVRGRRR